MILVDAQCLHENNEFHVFLLGFLLCQTKDVILEGLTSLNISTAFSLIEILQNFAEVFILRWLH